MCGRFALFTDPPPVTIRLGLPDPETGWAPRYNVAPGTWITGVRRTVFDAEPTIGDLWWGYRPAWAGSKAPQPINAKVETVATSRYFQAAFKRHRCLVPADGWYEWLPTVSGKQPYYLCREDREPLFLAGICAERADGSFGCAIVTEPARGIARNIHDRMPLALDDESLAPWLDPDLTDRDAISSVVRHLDAALVTHWPVSTRVNRPANDDPSLIEPDPANG
ncbi:SOS response-associated peptidase [Halomonas sp. EGI 63088]|uniref:Abasic site processing protein n=1 Tax=Halomonas flagellata TaxID=2920385 RepID=A0ABS9RU04_9GAMM|nr:SOS response-associated peptidase [Halomonas flagellata]MCH4563332.1 SOS response-associated peptidase [Halomonas flagellata]